MFTIRVLGSGTSSGVPTIGCQCPTCTSTDPHDKRLRPSIWITDEATSVIIDTSSDFRQQCLQANIHSLDGILYTHHHFDHIAGFDDLRAYNYRLRRPVPIYLMEATLNELRSMFRYAFEKNLLQESSIPAVEINEIGNNRFDIGTLSFLPLELRHGSMKVNGYRVGRFAYCTDCNFIPDHTLQQMQGLDVLILDALRHTEHPTHFSLAQAIEVAAGINARQTYFTHIAHDIKHADVEALLPPSMNLAYDGLTINIL